MWMQIHSPAPVLNTSDFRFVFGGKTGSEIPLNSYGHPHFFEFVALKGSYFKIEDKNLSSNILRVSSSTYPNSPLFIDSRFGNFVEKKGEESLQELPSSEEILSRMNFLLGKPYVWGGNWSCGISEMLSFYPPKKPLDKPTKTLWTFAGVDCSGLLYEATGGLTPRNTKELLQFGTPLPIPNGSIDQIVSQLKPLDMILYPGHVLFVLNSSETIESKSPIGVIKRNLKERLLEISRESIGNAPFTIRRFSKA